MAGKNVAARNNSASSFVRACCNRITRLRICEVTGCYSSSDKLVQIGTDTRVWICSNCQYVKLRPQWNSDQTESCLTNQYSSSSWGTFLPSLETEVSLVFTRGRSSFYPIYLHLPTEFLSNPFSQSMPASSKHSLSHLHTRTHAHICVWGMR
jgi:NMD protein affecting ribosome stability and mRNA decay